MNEPENTRRKPGPLPGPEKRQFTMMIEPDLGEWGKRQPGGLSELVRRLLREARAKAEKNAAAAGKTGETTP